MADKNKTPKQPEESLIVFGNAGSTSGLPAAVQKAIERSGIRTREVAGVAPTWKPEAGSYIIGEIVAIRSGVGEFGSDMVVMMTKDGPQTLWMGADLKTKFNGRVAIGQWYCIVYEGKLTKKDNPKLKNDMNLYKVVELLEPEKQR